MDFLIHPFIIHSLQLKIISYVMATRFHLSIFMFHCIFTVSVFQMKVHVWSRCGLLLSMLGSACFCEQMCSIVRLNWTKHSSWISDDNLYTVLQSCHTA